MEFLKQGDTQYFQQGSSPKLLIMSGTHGDEYQVIPMVQQAVETIMPALPDFMYIPRVSPSADTLATHKNKFGHDLNRNFSVLDDPEAEAVRTILRGLDSVVGVSFHQDFEFNQFYFYDTQILEKPMLEEFRSKVRELEIPLFTGIDQADDPALCYEIREGYIDYVGAPSSHGQFIEDWGMHHGKIKRFFTFEIPHEYKNAPALVKLCIELALQVINLP